MSCTCSYCSKNSQLRKPTVRIKSASSYDKRKKLSELGAIIKGVSYPEISYVGSSTKGASNIESKSQKLKELGKLIRGF